MPAHHPRPLVVLAGWLGCQPRLLRRYTALYERAGCRVLCRIAPPHTVMRSVYGMEPVKLPSIVSWRYPPLDAGSSFPTTTSETIALAAPAPPQAESMQELAWDILRCIHHAPSSSSPVLFHVFSNGGCFVWEQVRTILRESSQPLISNDDDDNNRIPLDEQQQAQIKTDLLQIQQRMVGVVFDSGPCWGLSSIGDALAYCTWRERLEVARKSGLDYWWINQAARQKVIQLRNSAFFQSLQDEEWDLPQLYLYSKDDALCLFDALDALVRHRQQLLGRDRVSRVAWESSPHVRHLMENPHEYQAAVESFLDTCLRSERLQSKL